MPVAKWYHTIADNPRLRLWIYAALVLVFAILSVFPRPYVARAKIVPQDTSVTAASTTTLLGALGSGAAGIGSLLTGGRPSNDLYLIIGRSDSVTDLVIKRLRLAGPGARFASSRDAKLWLDRHVDIHLLLGGAMEISTRLHDPDEAVRITRAYEQAISNQLAGFGGQLIQNKKRLVSERFRDAQERLTKAESALTNFQRTYTLPAPEAQFGATVTRRTALEGQIQAKQVEIQTLREFRGPDSTELREAEAQLAALRGQLANTAPPALSLSEVSTRYLTLFRNYQFQQAIYAIYQRSAEQVEVEQLAADSASYIQIIDDAHVDADRKFNIPALALLVGAILAAIFTEWYGPATGLFTRKGLRRPQSDVIGSGE